MVACVDEIRDYGEHPEDDEGEGEVCPDAEVVERSRVDGVEV